MGDINPPEHTTDSMVVKKDVDVPENFVVRAKGKSGHTTNAAHYGGNVTVQKKTIIATDGVADGNTTGVRIDGSFKGTGDVIVGVNTDVKEIQALMALLPPKQEEEEESDYVYNLC